MTSYNDFLASACPAGDVRCAQLVYTPKKVVFCYELIGWEACVPTGKEEILSWKQRADEILLARMKERVEVRGLFVVTDMELKTWKVIEQHKELKRLTLSRPQLTEEEYIRLKGALDEQYEQLKTWHNARTRKAKAA